jgi:multisubunit Na+/H+ antiporter MnhF subunit
LNAFEVAGTVLLAGFFPLLWCAATRRAIDGLVALELAGTLTVLVLLCFGEGFHRSFEFGVAIVAAVLAWAGGLVFARFLGRWL